MGTCVCEQHVIKCVYVFAFVNVNVYILCPDVLCTDFNGCVC